MPLPTAPEHYSDDALQPAPAEIVEWWSARKLDALEAALHKLRTMRSLRSLASRSGSTGSASPSPLCTQFQSGTSAPSPLCSHFVPALPPPIEDDVSPTFSYFIFTTETPTDNEHMEPEPASASDDLEGESTRDEALSVPPPKPKRKSSKTLLDVPSPSPARRRASHLDSPRSAILQDGERIGDEVFPSASPEERVPSSDFDFHRAGEEEEKDRVHWRDSIRCPVSTGSLEPSTPPRLPVSSTVWSRAPRTHTCRSSKSSGKEAKTQRSRTVLFVSTLWSRRTAMMTPEPVPPVPQVGSSDSRHSRVVSPIASGLGMPASY
ncbi:hypothetical protein AURDEDRAFT_155349 [Auricularia subglabra TFB-10046 SS5]|nr:hypothetical protein AURDEDRAFT_155349 [Auricularia subglabra TFB-10046 SS5]